MRTVIAVILSLILFGTVSAAVKGEKASVAGKWHFVLQTGGGDRMVDPTFQQEGDRVRGKWNDSDVAGTFADGKLDLAFPINSEEAGSGTLKLKGKLNDDVLSGTWEFQDYSGEFTATRVK